MKKSRNKKINPPNYEGREKRLWKANAKKVVDDLNAGDKYILKKIENYSWRFGISQKEVEKEIRRNTLFANSFATEPRRQGLHEKTAADWLKRHEPLISNFETLPKSGKDALLINSDGEIVLRKHSRAKPSKTLDFRWATGKYTVYATHKYTKEPGGGQDNQFKEVLELLKKFQNGSASEDCILFAIVDGPYYTEAKLEELNKLTRPNPPLSYATNIEGVIPFLQKLK